MLIKRIKKRIQKYKRYDRETWKSIGGIYAIFDCAASKLFKGVSIEQYFAMDFWRKSRRERAEYLTYQDDRRIYNYIKDHATEDQFWCIGDKLQFNRFFSGFIRREFLFAPESDEASIRAFIDKHGTVMAKELRNTKGKGMLRVSKKELSSELIEQLISGKQLLEEGIVQHHDLARINASSVNTIRICTAIDLQKRAHIIGACIRCGAPGQYVDNYHAGGIAYPIDVDLGIVTNSGIPYRSIERPKIHPGGGTMMIGLRIPNWEELVQQVIKAAEMIPEMSYLGWDIAVTEDGVDFIEANIGQDSTLIQIDHKGKREMIRNLLPMNFQ